MPRSALVCPAYRLEEDGALVLQVLTAAGTPEQVGNGSGATDALEKAGRAAPRWQLSRDKMAAAQPTFCGRFVRIHYPEGSIYLRC